MTGWRRIALAAAAALWAVSASAQGTVGGLRIVDEAGTTIGQEAAPAGEKLFRLPAGVTAFLVAMDFEGSAATDVQLRVMGPSGTVLHESSRSIAEPQTATFEVRNDGQPFAEQEYVINAYVGEESYLADSLQLVVGNAQLASVEGEATTSSSSLDPLSASEGSGAAATTGGAEPTAAEVPGGPSKAVLALAIAGIVVLFAIVLWAGWSATRRA